MTGYLYTPSTYYERFQCITDVISGDTNKVVSKVHSLW